MAFRWGRPDVVYIVASEDAALVVRNALHEVAHAAHGTLFTEGDGHGAAWKAIYTHAASQLLGVQIDTASAGTSQEADAIVLAAVRARVKSWWHLYLLVLR